MSEQDIGAIFDDVVGVEPTKNAVEGNISDTIENDLDSSTVEVSEDLGDIWNEVFEEAEDTSDVVTDLDVEELMEATDDISEEAEDLDVDIVDLEKVVVEDGEPSVEGTVKIYDKNGKELAISEDAEIEILVDGESVKMSLNEFRSDMSGQKAIAQRFSALDNERKALEERKGAIDAVEQTVHGLMQQGQVWQAMEYIFNATGYSGDQVIGQFLDQISEPLQKYANMTPEEQKVWAANAQAERTRLELDKLNQEKLSLQARTEQENEVRRVQQLVGLDDATFAQRYHELRDDIQNGRLREMEITADLVGHYHVICERQEWAHNALKNVRPDLANDADIIDDVLRVIVRNFDSQGRPVGQEDIESIISQAYGDPALKKKSESVKQALEKKGNPASKKISSAPAQKKALREPTTKSHFLDAMGNMSDKELAKAVEKWAK